MKSKALFTGNTIGFCKENQISDQTKQYSVDFKSKHSFFNSNLKLNNILLQFLTNHSQYLFKNRNIL